MISSTSIDDAYISRRVSNCHGQSRCV